MAKTKLLRDFVNKRLAAAAEEIFVAIERAMVEYAEEVTRIAILSGDNKAKSRAVAQRADCPQRSDIEEVSPDPGQSCDVNPSAGQEDPHRLQIKREQDLWSVSGEEQLQAFKDEEANIKLAIPPFCLKTEQNQDPSALVDQPQSAEVTEEEAQPSSDCQPLSPESETEDSDCDGAWKPCGQSLSKQKEEEINSVKLLHSGLPRHSCKACGKSFCYTKSFFKHVGMHANCKECVCGGCGRLLESKESLMHHLHSCIGTSVEKVVSVNVNHKERKRNYAALCSVCGRNFRDTTDLTRHMRTHRRKKTDGEGSAGMTSHKVHMTSTRLMQKLCSVCGKCFRDTTDLRRHMRIHWRDAI